MLRSAQEIQRKQAAKAVDKPASTDATSKQAAEVAADDLILDIGPQTAAQLAEQLKAAGTIVWNGPVGVFEFEAFSHGTETIARAIAAESPEPWSSSTRSGMIFALYAIPAVARPLPVVCAIVPATWVPWPKESFGCRSSSMKSNGLTKVEWRRSGARLKRPRLS